MLQSIGALKSAIVVLSKHHSSLAQVRVLFRDSGTLARSVFLFVFPLRAASYSVRKPRGGGCWHYLGGTHEKKKSILFAYTACCFQARGKNTFWARERRPKMNEKKKK